MLEKANNSKENISNKPYPAYHCCHSTGEGLDLKFGGISTLSYHRTPLARKYSIIGSSRDVHGYAEAELAANLQLWTVAALARCD